MFRFYDDFFGMIFDDGRGFSKRTAPHERDRKHERAKARKREARMGEDEKNIFIYEKS